MLLARSSGLCSAVLCFAAWSLAGSPARGEPTPTPVPAPTPAPAAPAPAAPAAPAAAPVVTKAVVPAAPVFKLTADEQTLLDLTNAERRKVNLPALAMHPTLMRVAREQSQAMAMAGVLSHAVGGRTLTIRLQQSGYGSLTAAENCAEGQATPAQAISTWSFSPGHRANMLGGQFREVGVAVAWGVNGRPYYTQVFGANGVVVILPATVVPAPVTPAPVPSPSPAPAAPASAPAAK